MQCHVEHCLFDYHKHVSNTTQTSKRCAMLQRLKDCMNRKAEHCRRTDRRFAFIDEKRQESVKSYKCVELEAKKGLLWCHNKIICDVRVSKLQFAFYDNSDFRLRDVNTAWTHLTLTALSSKNNTRSLIKLLWVFNLYMFLRLFLQIFILSQAFLFEVNTSLNHLTKLYLSFTATFLKLFYLFILSLYTYTYFCMTFH